MNDIEALGASNFCSIYCDTCWVFLLDMFLWHPFANKLKRKSKEEVRQKMMMIEGILSVLEGEAPRVIEQKLASYLSMEERRKLAAKNTSDKEAGQVVEET